LQRLFCREDRCELRLLCVRIWISLFLIAVPVLAQSGGGSLHGQVTDPSGAVIPDAQVSVSVPGGASRSTTSDGSGFYQLGNLAPGKYSVSAHAKGFAPFAKQEVQVDAERAAQFNISLDIEVEKEQVEVEEETPQVQTDASSNTSAIVLKGQDLEALPDDPDELQEDLQALAGPSAGPNGGQIYIDGFTGGQLPPKASIREIRINQNPFSAEYDKLGYGRIEIFTKPGTDKFHGQVSVMGNASALNSTNPYLTAAEPPYDSTIYMGSVGGPINKKSSFFVDFQRRNINEVAVVNSTLFNGSVPNPMTRTNIAPRLDYQTTKNNTLTARYQYYRDTQDNSGVGGLNQPSTGYDMASTEHTVQISDTQVLNAKAVNETRFQYLRDNTEQNPLSTQPTINVIDSFTSGGSNAGQQTSHTDRYELQNYTSYALGSHLLKFGARLRVARQVDVSGQEFNGNFTFADLDAFNAKTPTQFSLTAAPTPGIPQVSDTLADAGLYIQDEWKVRSNLSVSYGLRFETQNDIHDHADWAPRIGFAWGVDGGGKEAAKTVLRAGFGMFYDRFLQAQVLNAERLNGITQQQYILPCAPTPQNPAPCSFYPNVPPVNQLPAQTVPTIYQINPDLRAPYIIQSAVSVERQITKSSNITISYLNSRGVHQFLSLNANAPLPGTPFSGGPRPDPSAGNIYQYASEGIFKQNQLIANFNIRAGARLNLVGYYTLNYANSDTSDVSTFASNSYDVSQDYGRATFGIRHRLFFGGTVALPYAFRLSPFMIVTSGTPYNVTAGQDLSGDSLFNDRVSFLSSPACSQSPTLIKGQFCIPSVAYTPIPSNYLTGPMHFTLNLRLAKTFGFGPETGGGAGQRQGEGASGGGPHGGGGPRGGGGGGGGFGGPRGGLGLGPASSRRYSLTFSINARNVLNHVNPATPIGTLSSPDFGQSIALAGFGPANSPAYNRKLELQAMFSF
jgi:carboxypeptidase family protein